MLTSDFQLFASYSLYADLAHLVERNLAKVEVASSSLVIRSKTKGRKNLILRPFYTNGAIAKW